MGCEIKPSQAAAPRRGFPSRPQIVPPLIILVLATWLATWPLTPAPLIAGDTIAADPADNATDPVARPQPAPLTLRASGQTMGTGYSVRLQSPPGDFPRDWPQRVDAELRRVNDQMSTYLQSSEISRFNASRDTDWFAVSPETAAVVDKSLEIYRLSDGAFDVTVGRLVNLWSFGPEPRRFQPPTAEAIEQALANVGSDKLQVRLQPPALRKAHAELQIDLSAIAKGHGVDRVIELLRRLGARNAFVEIGGEVRAIGQKIGGQPTDQVDWMVGIQTPDRRGQVVASALPLRDQAIATSGDYRNFFEHQGRRYSHTIDPRTGQPVDHDLASVTVLADDCMSADGWATALSVLGPDQALLLARQLNLNVLLISRSRADHRSAGRYTFRGTGQLDQPDSPDPQTGRPN